MKLYSTIIDDYDELKKDYLINCEETDIEPTENGEIGYFNEILEFCDWRDSISELDVFNNYALIGTLGLCNGEKKIEIEVNNNPIELIEKCLSSSINDIEIYLINGIIEIKAYHHDGTNHFHLVALNKRADKYILNNDIENDDVLAKLEKPYYHAKMAF